MESVFITPFCDEPDPSVFEAEDGTKVPETDPGSGTEAISAP